MVNICDTCANKYSCLFDARVRTECALYKSVETKDVHITLPIKMYENLKRTAEDLGTSMSDVIATLLSVRTHVNEILEMEDDLK